MAEQPPDLLGSVGETTRRAVLSTIGAGVTAGLAGCTGDQNGDGGSPDSVTPGEVVHNSLEGIEVLDHWATSQDRVKLDIRNTGDSQLVAPAGFSEGDPVIQGRTLNPDGNVLGEGRWQTGGFGPDTVDAGTEATIGFLTNAGASNAERYELCLTTSPLGGLSTASWDELCGE